jgi:tetratricopeptide (TPR) repeat protein/tRNA A-37 threonylcarbamoyl transferase component Bud32
MTTVPTLTQEGGERVEGDAPTHIDDRYTVLSYLGHGGMGVVYRARDRLRNNIVALKRMAEGPRLALAREFRTLSTLRHPNIISVLDYGFGAQGGPFFTMELIEKPKTLLEAASGLDVRCKIDLLVQVLRALSYLHRRGVFHRDLKPSNVLVDDRVRVLDFGIAIHRGEHSSFSGTLSHIAPEVLQGQLGTEASDIYAVGVMAYEVLAGHHPFRGYVDDALRAAVLADEPDLGVIPDALRPIVGRMLAKDPARRGTADEAIDALIEAVSLDMPRQTHATRESFIEAASFVGRVGEQRVLADAVARLMTGSGGLYLVEGESGIGKTRLLDEVRTLALVEGAKVVRGQAAGDARGAFDVWREPLRHLLLGTSIDNAIASTLAALIPDIEEILGQPVTPAPSNPQTARAQMLAAISAVFERQIAPVLLIIEDLQWAREALDVLRELAPKLVRLPVLVIASVRSDEAPGLGQSIADAIPLRLAPLARGDIASLASSMLGSTRPTVVDFLVRHTEGNLFFLVETVRALAEESGTLEQIGEHPLPERFVTSGIEAVIARRFAKLPPAVLPVLTYWAVVGRELDQPLLAQTFGNTFADALAAASDAGVVAVDENGFRFAHDKFREHVLDSLAAPARRALHADVATAIERVHGGGKAWAAALAFHYRQAELPEREAPFSSLAGQAALEQGAYVDAERLLERALAISSDRSARLDVLLHYGAVLRALRGWSSPKVREIYDAVIELAAELGVEERTIPALQGIAIGAAFSGDLETGRELATRVAKLAETSGDVVGRIQAAVVLANVAKWSGDHAAADVQHRRIDELYDPAQLSLHLSRYGWNPKIVAALTHAASTCIGGDPERAVQIYREALAAAEATANPFTIAIALQIGGWVHHLRRDIADTLHYANALGKLASEHGFPVFTVLADALGGWAMTHGGDESGLARVRGAIAMQRNFGGMAMTFYVSHLADACLVAGEIDEAFAILQETLDDNATTHERCYHPELYRLLGRAWRARGDRDRARDAFVRAVSLAREQGARLFEQRASNDLAEIS